MLAYPSLAYDLALRIEAGEVSPVRVPVINVTAEPLYEFQRRKIETCLADHVYSRYGAREFGTVAFECRQKQGLHIIAESVYIEIIPSFFNNDVGVVLVTDLLNKTMPLIRYRIGDLAKVDESKCSCGLELPRLLEIQGREVDTIWRPDGTGLPGFQIVILVGQCGIDTKVQVVQKKPEEIIIRVQGRLDEHKSAIDRLLDIFREVIGNDINYLVCQVEKIERAPSGKYRYVISDVKRPVAG